jgi:SAM-dependent methyltransferase
MRSGNATTIQIPAALVATVDAFRRGMDRLQEEASAGSFDEAALQRAVAEQCDALLTGLEAELTPEALVDAGWSDLLSLRDTSAVAAGLGDYVYREALPFLLQSSAFAHCAARAGGFAGDAETEAVLLQPDADGDGVLGPGVDAWFRHRAFVQSRRERREMIEPLLRAVVPGGHVFVLGGGNGRELRRALGQEVHATVVDSDPEALAALGQRLARAGSRDLVTLVQADILGVVRGVTPMSLPPLSFAYAVGLSDHLTSDQMAEVIEWAAGLLSPGGTLAATFTAADCPDRVLVDEVIGWRVQRWTEEAARSVFGRRKAEMIRSATGVTLLATSRG